MSRNPNEQIVHFLSDLYSVELQALAQLNTAPAMAGDPQIAADFRRHHGETESHAERVRGRLEELGGAPSAIKDAIMKLGGKGFLLFAGLQSETPGRLIVHAYSYEAMEAAAYAALAAMADAAGDAKTAALARAIEAGERDMMRRLEKGFDGAEAASHETVAAADLAGHVRSHLAEAHALVSQSVKILDKSQDISDADSLAREFAIQREAGRAQLAAIERRLEDLGHSPSALQDVALKLGALNWGLFFQSQTDTPAKLLTFVYAVKHLDIAGFEMLRRTSKRAGDDATRRLCEEILEADRAMAETLENLTDAAARATFREVG